MSRRGRAGRLTRSATDSWWEKARAVLILESLEYAQRRGREHSGGDCRAMACRATRFTSRSLRRMAMGRIASMRASLKDAGIAAGADRLRERAWNFDADWRCDRDAGDQARFRRAAKKIPVSSTKSMTGHLLGGAGGLEAGISVLALRDQILPPTINYETPDPACDLDYVPNHSAQGELRYALSNSFGFGGTNASLVFKRGKSSAARGGCLKIGVCVKQVPAKDAPLAMMRAARGFARRTSDLRRTSRTASRSKKRCV